MSDVYTTKVIRQLVNNGSPVTYTVPAGYRLIISDITVIIASTGATFTSIQDQASCIIWFVANAAQYAMFSSKQRHVLDGGEQLKFTSTGANAYFSVVGSLLLLP